MRRILIVLLPAVTTACQTYAQHRAALVPHATPLPYDGQPMQSTAQLSLGASNVHDLVKPAVGNPDAGDALPSTQLRAMLGLRAARNWSIGIVHERGLSAGSAPVSSSEPPVKGDDVSSLGMTFGYSIKTGSPGWRIGVSTELLFWSVPWVQYSTCIQFCTVPGFTFSDRGTDSVATLAMGIIPSYRSGPFTIFGGVTARNHPTITEKIITNVPSDAEVQPGPYNLTLHAGVDIDVGAGIRASLLAHQTVTKDPIDYGPGFSVMVTVPLGRDVPRAKATRTPSAPPGVTPFGPPGATPTI